MSQGLNGSSIKRTRGRLSQQPQFVASSANSTSVQPPASQPSAKQDDQKNPVQVLRHESGLSQRDFASKLNISRAHLQRLEQKTCERLSLGEISIVVSRLGLNVERVIRRFNPVGMSLSKKYCHNEPAFKIILNEGASLSSLCEKNTQFFMGVLSLKARASWTDPYLPSYINASLMTIEGILLLTLGKKEYLLKPGECMSFGSSSSFEVYNPDQLKLVKALLVSMPPMF